MANSSTEAIYPRHDGPRADYQDSHAYPPPLRPAFAEDESYPGAYPQPGLYPSNVLPPSPPVTTFAPSTPATSSHSSYNSSRSLPTLSNMPPPLSAKPTGEYVHIHSYGPREGPRGTTVMIRCDVNLPASPPPSASPSASASSSGSGRKMMRLCFGSTPAATKVVQLSSVAPGESGYELSAAVPAMQQPGNHKFEIKVQVLSETHLVLGETICGVFDYYHQEYHPSPRAPNKRSGEPLVSDRIVPSPRLTPHHPSYHRSVSDQHMLPGESPELPPADGFAARSLPSRYRQQSEADEYAQGAGSGQSHASNGSQPPDAADWQRSNPPYASSSTVTPPSASALLPAVLSPGVPPAQPALLRTSQLAPTSSAPAFYIAPQNNKASLVLQGDLNTMAVGWDQDEWHQRRRLVQFWRRQQGSEIHAVFRPIHQEQFQQNSIVISCIYREDRNECYVTSVDAIYLLEALVGVRFTVEEKNRIRRNLEGFRPITVSKTKAGSEDFFKLIMGFPNPKPRNIEKDVKVFPWSIFGPALKKIISKYSASYPSSTATTSYPTNPSPTTYNVPGPLQPPAPSVYMQPSYSPPHVYDGPPKHDLGAYRSEGQYAVGVDPHPHPGGYNYYPPPAPYETSQYVGPPPLPPANGRSELHPVYPVGP